MYLIEFYFSNYVRMLYKYKLKVIKQLYIIFGLTHTIKFINITIN